MQVFVDEGYERASMDRIAEAAGASKRTVYNYYPSKEILFRAVIARFAAQLESQSEIPYDRSLGLEAQLGRFIDVELSMIENPTWLGFIKSLLSIIVRNPGFYQEALSQYASEKGALVAWIRSAAQDGTLVVDDPGTAARVFASMVSGAFTWPAVYQGVVDHDANRRMKDELIRMFLCRYQSR